MLATVLLLSSFVPAASIEDAFVVRAPMGTVTKWMLENQNALAASMKCKVIARKGDLARLVKRSAKGEFDIVVRERITQDSTGMILYTSTMVQSVSGGMARNDIVVTLRPYGSGTLISVRAVVEVPHLPPYQINIGLKSSLRGFRNLMGATFR